MEKTLGAYTDDHIREYFDRVKKDGLTEHGFPRLTSVLGILVSRGKRTELTPLFLEMMDFCCQSIPNRKAANDFSVREIVTCIAEVEKSGTVPRERTEEWKSSLSRIDPEKTYDVYAVTPCDNVRNWALFTAVSEYARLKHGIGGSVDFIELQIASQLQWFDENGMYSDRKGGDDRQPFVYDIVPRALFSMLLNFGYDGKYRSRIDEILKKAGLVTLKTQSVTGELPFGGRSNQFLHNEAWLAAVLEFEAVRYKREGDEDAARRFASAAALAVSEVERRLSEDGISHIKNRFPVESGYGCEGYAYFDKYMVTTASVLYAACLISDGSIPFSAKRDVSPSAFETSGRFHKVFLCCGEYFAEFEKNADPKYDASGLGRVHKAGAPSEICLSVPCPASDRSKYLIDLPHSPAQAICPAVPSDGGWVYGTDGDFSYSTVSLTEENNAASAVIRCTAGEKKLLMSICVSADGVALTLTGEGAVGCLLPAFEFDGETKTDITAADRTVTVCYRGWECVYATDGTVADAGFTSGNRNGYYRAFLATGEKKLNVRIEIRKK